MAWEFFRTIGMAFCTRHVVDALNIRKMPVKINGKIGHAVYLKTQWPRSISEDAATADRQCFRPCAAWDAAGDACGGKLWARLQGDLGQRVS